MREIIVEKVQKETEVKKKKDTVALQSELRRSENIEQFVAENETEFDIVSVADYVSGLLKKYNLEKCDVTKRGGFTGNYLYQIFNGKKNPSRDKLIQIALGFSLTLEETQKLLRLGGYAELYVRDSRDAFLMFGLEKRYSLQELNELLYKNKKKIIE
ncbi:MAG: hypothetical protein J6J38_01360 [Lachnospiraceae bacterium]|nr:hypothetical protein [Lachnospiraceae bacterium]